MRYDLIFITGNQNKADFLAKWLGMPIEHQKIDLDEIQSLNPREVVEHKVRQAYEIVKRPVLVEDVSLVLSALGRLPGPFTKWFVESLGLDGCVNLAQKLSDKTAVGLVTYGFYDGKDLQFFDGEMRGKIADKPRGGGGFGFDPIFINDGYDKTRAEMIEEEYVESSYRTPAIKKLREYLNKTSS